MTISCHAVGCGDDDEGIAVTKFEMLTLGFTLGVLARTLLRLLSETRADAERERATQDHATTMRLLAGLPAVSHDVPVPPPPPLRSVMPPRYTDRNR